MRIIRFGDSGPEVRDIQRRLDELGLPIDDVPGDFGEATLQAVRTFQQRRGLIADGLVGPDTFRSLVEAGFQLGDRLLYLTQPMLRGDDVRTVQQRLNQLGFDCGQVDGIYGPDTAAAVADFQVNVGIEPDGKAGADTMAILGRLRRSHQAVPASDVRERYRLATRTGRPSLAGVPILVDPGKGPELPGYSSPDGHPEHEITWAIANRVAGRLAALGARPILSRGPATTPTMSERAALANREGAEAILSIHTNGLPSPEARGAAAYHFGSEASVSEEGRRLAELAIGRICTVTGTPNCRTHPSTSALLRESRAVAAIVEVGFLTHPEEGKQLTDPEYQLTIANCLVDALSEFLLA